MKLRVQSVLLIEDQRDVSASIGAYLESIGYSVDYALDGADGIRLATANGYDAIILDIGLPKLDGLAVSRELRSLHGHLTPILMISARNTLDDRLTGIPAGGDDYLGKPFAPRELRARLRALTYRAQGGLGGQISKVGDLTLDTAANSAVRGDHELDLTETEMRLLQILMRASPAIVSRRDMARELWGTEQPDSDALRSHLYNLRKAIDRPFDQPLLHTVLGAGYRIGVGTA